MKATFRIHDPRLLLEAAPGELFVPLGPHLVECVCAIRSAEAGNGVQPDQPPADRLNPDALVPVVVVACRVEPGSPEHYPPGYQAVLPGASPIVFMRQLQSLQLAPREMRGAPAAERHAMASLVAVHAADYETDLARAELASRL